MPGLARKLLIFAAVEELILQPLAPRGQRQLPAVKIAYGGGINPVLGKAVELSGEEKSFEAFGIVGILNVPGSSYLISIVRRQQVAQIHGKAVFVVSEISLTPLTSQKDAERSIGHTANSLRKRSADVHPLDESDSDDEGDLSSAANDDVEDDETHANAADTSQAVGFTPGALHKRTSSIAEDVISRKGGYGRFAASWFSKSGWTADRRRNLGLSVSDSPMTSDEPSAIEETKASGPAAIATIDLESKGSSKVVSKRDKPASLLHKLLKTTQLLFGSSRSFFFSYDLDISRSLANSNLVSGLDGLLFQRTDPLFFWNRNIIQPFIDARQNHVVLPLMQGYVGQRSFVIEKHPTAAVNPVTTDVEMKEVHLDTGSLPPLEVPTTPGEGAVQSSCDVPEEESNQPTKTPESPVEEDQAQSFLLTIISRRSVRRAGLRYLRRGIDDDGNVANFVETEQILSRTDWTPSSKAYSFLQIRGSVPLFFSQSPYSFKPVPQMQHSAERNLAALKKHFSTLASRYGTLQVTSLVGKHDSEAILGKKYEETMARVNESGGVEGVNVGFEWFDFHAVCKGMKFENVSILLDTLAPQLDSFGYSVQMDGGLVAKQCGILRTNCMDCLDRTNVVQSAAGRRALEQQLQQEGFDLNAQTDQRTDWFNTLWADNGDAVSKQYASTAALKGDFTRTKKRNYQGALKDMGLSISRFYSGIVNDYFSQAAIDFLVGNVTYMVFDEFEANMMSEDPSISMHKMRQQAIEVSQKLVVADDGEELVGGWAMLTPHESNTIKSTPFEESVLLLTDAALYACRFDWNMEKVSSFERVDLRHVVSIRHGAYVTSTLSAAQSDENKNVGFVVTYKAGIHDVRRVNTRSLSSFTSSDDSDLLHGYSVVPVAVPGSKGSPAAIKTRILAWKALPAQSAASHDSETKRMSETEQVAMICSEIERTLNLLHLQEPGADRKSIIEQGDIISLADARKSTGLFDQLSHSLKKLVWAS